MKKISIVILVIFMPLGNIFALSESEKVIAHLEQEKMDQEQKESAKIVGSSVGVMFGVTYAAIISTSFWNPAG